MISKIFIDKNSGRKILVSFMRGTDKDIDRFINESGCCAKFVCKKGFDMSYWINEFGYTRYVLFEEENKNNGISLDGAYSIEI